MTVTAEIVAAILAVITLVSAGSALFVSMKVSGGLDKFEIHLMQSLEDKFMKRVECVQYEAMRKEMEGNYRAGVRSDIEGIQVEIRRDKDDLNIQLKGILTAIERKK